VPLKQVRYVFTITGYAKVFTRWASGVAGQYPWIKKVENMGWRVQDLAGSSTLQDLSIVVNDGTAGDRTISITADRVAFTFEGAAATLKLGFPGLSQSTDFITVATLVIDHLETVDNGTAYRFVMRDQTIRALKTRIYATGDNGRPTSSKNPKSLGTGSATASSGNPMDLLLDILQNQLSLAAGQINLTAINNYKAGLLSGYRMRFALTRAPEAKQFIDLEIMKALGGWSFQNSSGLFTPVFEIPNATVASVMNLGDKQFVETPVLNPGKVSAGQTLVNVVSYRLDFDGSNFQSEIAELNATSFSQFGAGMIHAIQARGARSYEGGWAMGRVGSNTVMQRWGFHAPQYYIKCFLPAVVLEPGDYINFSSSFLVNAVTGKLGVTNVLCEVLGVTRDFEQGIVELGLLDVSWLNTSTMGAYQVAPDGTPSWPTANSTQRVTYQFISSAVTGKYSTGDTGHSIW
jgi:hypothetical protein